MCNKYFHNLKSKIRILFKKQMFLGVNFMFFIDFVKFSIKNNNVLSIYELKISCFKKKKIKQIINQFLVPLHKIKNIKLWQV